MALSSSKCVKKGNISWKLLLILSYWKKREGHIFVCLCDCILACVVTTNATKWIAYTVINLCDERSCEHVSFLLIVAAGCPWKMVSSGASLALCASSLSWMSFSSSSPSGNLPRSSPASIQTFPNCTKLSKSTCWWMYTCGCCSLLGDLNSPQHKHCYDNYDDILHIFIAPGLWLEKYFNGNDVKFFCKEKRLIPHKQSLFPNPAANFTPSIKFAINKNVPIKVIYHTHTHARTHTRAHTVLSQHQQLNLPHTINNNHNTNCPCLPLLFRASVWSWVHITRWLRWSSWATVLINSYHRPEDYCLRQNGVTLHGDVLTVVLVTWSSCHWFLAPVQAHSCRYPLSHEHRFLTYSIQLYGWHHQPDHHSPSWYHQDIVTPPGKSPF